MQLTRQTKFIFAITLQVAIIAVIIVTKVAVLRSGVDVYLRILPVDPRDPLRGDYVTFRYEISTLDRNIFTEKTLRNGDVVYVILEPRGKLWYALRVKETKPTGDGEVFIKGKIASGGLGEQIDLRGLRGQPLSGIRVAYGIEQYFIPEGAGAGLNTRDAFAKVILDKSGNAVLKQIYIDDKPWP